MRALMLIVAVVVAAPPSIAISARSRAVQPGEIVLLSITSPSSAAAVHVRAFAHDITAYRDGEHGWQALVGIDLDVKPGTYPVAVDARRRAGALRPRGRAARLPDAAAHGERSVRHPTAIRAAAHRSRSRR